MDPFLLFSIKREKFSTTGLQRPYTETYRGAKNAKSFTKNYWICCQLVNFFDYLYLWRLRHPRFAVVPFVAGLNGAPAQSF